MHVPPLPQLTTGQRDTFHGNLVTLEVDQLPDPVIRRPTRTPSGGGEGKPSGRLVTYVPYSPSFETPDEGATNGRLTEIRSVKSQAQPMSIIMPSRSYSSFKPTGASGSAAGLGRLLSEKVVCGNPEGIGVGPVPVNRHHSVDQIEWGRASTQSSFEVGNVSATLLNLALRIVVNCLRMPMASDDLVSGEVSTASSARFQLTLDSGVEPLSHM
jgi:hypothetical protein